jgi:hypothetical protein
MENLPIETKFKIYLRDLNQCTSCNKKAEDGVKLKIANITPRAAGGTNNVQNLKTLCEECSINYEGKGRQYFAPLKKHNRIPAEYAIGILKQALKNYRSNYENKELSFEETYAASNAPGLVRGINPLFHPLPKNAVIAAALALNGEGKILLEGNRIKLQ